MNQALIDEIKKLRRELESMRVELVAAKRKELKPGCLSVGFGDLAVLKENVRKGVFEAFLFNAGCRVKGKGGMDSVIRKKGDVFITPNGEEVRSPYGNQLPL